jgi:hypothetical protein
MPVPSRGFDIAAHGSAYKAVVCESCQTEFVYLLRRHALGSATSVLYLDCEGAKARAARDAAAALKRALARDHDPVPCPACGWYQRYMVTVLRRQHRRWMTLAGIICLYLAGLLFAIAVLAHFSADPVGVESAGAYGQAGAVVANLGCGLILIRWLLALRVRPNQGDAEARKQIGQSRAQIRGQFNEALRSPE